MPKEKRRPKGVPPRVRRKPARRGKARARATPAVPKTPVWDIAPEQQIVGATFLGKAREDLPPRKKLRLLLEAPLAAGDTIRIKGHTTDLTQRVEELEVGGHAAPAASAGETVSLTVADQVRAGDAVYKV